MFFIINISLTTTYAGTSQRPKVVLPVRSHISAHIRFEFEWHPNILVSGQSSFHGWRDGAWWWNWVGIDQSRFAIFVQSTNRHSANHLHYVQYRLGENVYTSVLHPGAGTTKTARSKFRFPADNKTAPDKFSILCWHYSLIRSLNFCFTLTSS